VVMSRLMVLTDRTQVSDETLLDRLRRIVDGGADTIVVREKDLPTSERRTLVEQVMTFTPTVIVASDVTLARAVGAHGVHLSANDDAVTDDDLIVGRSSHTLVEVVTGGAALDYVTLSPMFDSRSKPGYRSGTSVKDLAPATAVVPTFALGGIETPARVRTARDAGAFGVAVMGALMRDPHPEQLVRSMIEELECNRPSS